MPRLSDLIKLFSRGGEKEVGGDACVCSVGRWGYRDRAGSGLFWWCGGVLRALLSRSPSSPSGSSLELR